MAFSGASIKYKPLQIGFLVREGSVEDVVKAAGINSVLWGGLHNPIIPISAGDNKTAKQMMEMFSVDLLYAVTETPETQAFEKEYPYLRDPGHYAERIFYEDWGTKKLLSGVLDVKNLVDLYWSREFKFKPSGYKSQFLHLEWDDTDPLANVLAVEFGFFPGMNFKFDYKQGFIQGLRSQQQKLAQGDKLTMHPIKSTGPIGLTGFELRGYEGGSRNRGIYFGKSDSFQDLMTFWNMRAAGMRMVFIAIDHLERSKPYGQNYLDHLNTLPNRHPDSEDWLTAYHNIDDEAVVKNLSKEFTSKKPLAFAKIGSDYLLGLQPPYYVFKWQSGTTHIEKSHDRYVANIRLPEMNFLVDDDDLDVSSQQLGVILAPYGGDYDHPGHTLKIPRIRKLTEFYSRELTFDPWSLRVEPEGFSKIIKPKTEAVSLYPIPVQTLVEKLFETAGIEAKTSQAGLIARKVIEKMGDLEDARVLKIKGVRMLLEKGSAKDAVTRGQATLTIKDNDFDKHKRLFIEPRDGGDLDSNAVFNYLLKHDYFRAGLELKCGQCKLDNWLSLKGIDDYWECEYCGGRNQTSPHLNHKGDWKFRKSGLFSKDNHQEGAIPVLLTLLALKRVIDQSGLIYTTALELKSADVNCETDFFVLKEKRRDVLEMCIGECKSEGGVITDDDCQKLMKAAKQLSTLQDNAEVYIVFSKTNDVFLPEEIERFKKLPEGVRLILLTNRELEPYHPYWKEDGGTDEDVPVRYPHSLSDLWRNSYTRYLKEDKPAAGAAVSPEPSTE